MRPNLPSRIGRFEVLDRIGQGGMGILYLARDPVLERSVAIKVLSVHNQELLERFGREARSVASLRHHHIVTIYDIGEDDGNPFIAMEYIDGETLAEVIRRKSPLSLARKFELILQLCDGLGYAHRAGLIHRDIKPANLMITSDGVLKILDFGLARLVTDDTMLGLTVAGAIMGTPHYMSPEQIEGQRVDHRGDIFAVGLVIYELLTYCKAYPGDAPHSVLQKIMTTEPQPMHELEAGIDPELEQLVSQAIEKSPDRRYQELASLARDLSRIRLRLQTSASDPTVRIESGTPRSGASRGPMTPGQIPNLEAIARRRTAQIDGHVTEALRHFQGGRLEAAIEQCERAVLLDPNDVRALDLLRNVHRALEDRQVRAWLDEAQTNLSVSALTAAAALIEKALQLRPDSVEAQLLQRTLQERRREQERARERARAVRTAIDRALVHFRDGALEAAVRSTAEALAYDPNNEEAQALRRQTTAALDERRQKQELDQKASAAVSAARHYAAEGEYQRGLQLLRAFSPPHPLVEDAATEIAGEAAKVDERRRAEEEARRRARLEEETRQRARLEEEATQRARLDEEERQRARIEKEARQQARLDEEARQRARLAEEATERARLDEAAQRARIDEEARQQARLDEEARQRARVETEANNRRALEDDERRQEAELSAHQQEEARREQDEVESWAWRNRETAGRAATELVTQVGSAPLAPEEAAAATPELRLPEPGLMRDAAREAAATSVPHATWQPRRTHAIVGVAALAAAILAAVVLLRDPAPAPDSSSPTAPPIESPVSEPVELPSNVATPGSVPQTLQPAAPQTTASPAEGTLVLDALPWAEVVEIVDAAGKRQTLPANATTPIFLELPPGDYDITLKNGSSRTLKTRVTAGATTRPAPVDFGQIDAAEYFRRLKW